MPFHSGTCVDRLKIITTFIVMIFILSSCTPFGAGWLNFFSSASLSPNYPPIEVSSTTFNMTNGAGKTAGFPVQISGGTPPFTYSIVSGPGAVDAVTGLYTQASSWDPTVIKVTDSKGQTVLLNVVNTPVLVDGAINSMEIDGDNLFLAGNFESTDPEIHPVFSILNQSDGSLANFATAPCNYLSKFNVGAMASPYSVIREGDFIFIGGIFTGTTYRDSAVSNILKINFRTCELDKTFNAASLSTVGVVRSLYVDSSTNSLYAAGSITSYAGQSVGRIIKINMQTGQLDTTFSQTIGFDAEIIKIVGDGNNLYVGGAFLNYRGSPAQQVAKIDKTTGVLDTTFTQATGLIASSVEDMLIIGTHLYVATRDSGGVTYRGVASSLLVKLDLTSGNLDTTFSQTPSFGFPDKVLSLATDGTDIYVAGEFSSYRGVGCPRVIKLEGGSGAMITGFNWGTGATGGGGFYVYFDTVSNELLIDTGGGQTYNGVSTNQVIKVDKDTGVINSTFNDNFAISNGSYIQKIIFLPDNQILPVYYGSGATRSNSSRGLAKYNLLTWTKDPTFNVGTGFNGSVKTILVVGDYIYAGGTFTTYNGLPAQRLAKIHKVTGALDVGFTQATGLTGGALSTTVNSLATDGTGLYVCGMFAQYRGSNIQGFARVMLSTGNLDGVFTQATGLGANFTAMCNSVLNFNSSIYLTGTFVTYRGATAIRLAKVHPTTGVLDAVFTQATGLDTFSGGTALFDDGTDLYVSSSSLLYRGVGAPYLIKVNANSGNLDTTFSLATSGNVALKMLGIYDGQVIASGSSSGLTSYRGDPVKELISVSTTDGSLAIGYNTNLGFDSKANVLRKYQNKFLIAGDFTSYRGRPARNFLVIDPVTGNAP